MDKPKKTVRVVFEIPEGKGYVEPDDARYQRWINEHVATNPAQVCLNTAAAMAEEFPELRVVGVSNFLSGHAWCVNKADEVVDPTSHQFSSKFDYSVERLEREDFPVGKCHWCGETIWPDTPGAKKYVGEYESVGPHRSCDAAFEQECEEDRRLAAEENKRE